MTRSLKTYQRQVNARMRLETNVTRGFSIRFRPRAGRVGLTLRRDGRFAGFTTMTRAAMRRAADGSRTDSRGNAPASPTGGRS